MKEDIPPWMVVVIAPFTLLILAAAFVVSLSMTEDEFAKAFGGLLEHLGAQGFVMASVVLWLILYWLVLMVWIS